MAEHPIRTSDHLINITTHPIAMGLRKANIDSRHEINIIKTSDLIKTIIIVVHPTIGDIHTTIAHHRTRATIPMTADIHSTATSP